LLIFTYHPELQFKFNKHISNENFPQKPGLKKWLKITQVLNLKEKITFSFLFAVLIISSLTWGTMTYLSKTKAVPKFGGEYIEGIVGQPQHINPVISQSNNTDEDLAQLIYSSLFKYDDKGKITNDLTESYEISEDNTLYTVYLRKGVLWHDGEELKSDDIFFTINLISDPSYKSPTRSNWQGIETNIIDDYAISFKLQSPYAGFLHNLTFGILPKHIWETVSADKFSLTDLNIQPIGSGPYKFSSIQKDSNGNIISYKLIANPNYFDGKPYISKFTFNFYSDDDSILKAFNKKEIMGMNNISSQKLPEMKMEQSTFVHKIRIPRYFSVFFNQNKSFSLANDEVREALAYATNKQGIIDQVLNGNASVVNAPILPDMLGYSDEVEKYDFNLEKANQILDEKNWIRGEDGIRSKDGKILEFNLITTDLPELAKTAEIIKEQWEKMGAKISIGVYPIFDIQQNYIRPREYDALLFGEVLGGDPDPYSFWHSSQKKDPGLNLALFGTDEIDKLIEDARVEFDEEKRIELYKEFQQKLVREIPAEFLYTPTYIYPINKAVKGIAIENLVSPSKRFSNASKWYIKTKRIWK